ncbi:MAG: ATP-binding protein [Minicystis sp.]
MSEPERSSRLVQLAEEGTLSLRRQVNDLFAILGMPAVWRRQAPREIAQNLVELLTNLFRLDVACIRITDAYGDIDHRNPPELSWEVMETALDASVAELPTIELPRPNALGRTTVRLVAAYPLGEKGVVVVGSWRANFPTSHELLLLRTAVDQAALAMQSSRQRMAQERLVAEQARLREANAILTRLRAVTDRLSRARSSADVAEVVLSDGVAAVGAHAGVVCLFDEAHRGLELVQAVGRSGDLLLGRSWIALDADVPLADAARRAVPVLLSTPDHAVAYPETARELALTGSRAVAALPLLVEERCLGALGLSYSEPRAFVIEEQALLQAVAQQSAQAFDRARLLEAEQRAREAAQASQRRMEFLAEASAILASSLDDAATLQRLADVSVARIVDHCVIALAASDHAPEETLVVAHRDPARAGELRDVWHHLAFATDPRHPFGRALWSGAAELHREVDERLLEPVLPDAGERRRLLATGVRSLMIAPVTVRGRALGALVLGCAIPGHRFGPEDLEIAVELGRRVGLALDNAALYRSAREADRRKDEFLAILGHELRNPLAPIQAALQIMRLRGPSPFERERAIIERQVQHLVRLVDDLLDVSSIARGKVRLDRRCVDLQDIIAGAMEMQGPLLEQRGHTLAVETPLTPLIIEGDAGRLAQIVGNLLNNAAKYTERGGRITLSAERNGDLAILRVRDDGVGIAPDMLSRLFEMFTQEERSVDRALGGLGLGLAIVRGLVELHAGDVSVQSEGIGRGSEFLVRLPLALAATPDGSADAAPAGSPVPGRAPGSARILVVDDNRDAAGLLAEALAELGYATRVEHDGVAGLDAARAFQPQIALLDIGLPAMDGYELAARLRREPALRGIRLIAVTGYGQEDDKRRAAAAGFDAHVVKPLNIELLLALLGARGGDEPASP